MIVPDNGDCDHNSNENVRDYHRFCGETNGWAVESLVEESENTAMVLEDDKIRKEFI